MDAQNFRGGKIPDIKGYNPPIEVVIAEQIRTEMDGLLMNAIQKQGISVDKGELIRALQYDRRQYNVGYTNGYNDALRDRGWISVEDRLPDHDGKYLIYDGREVTVAIYTKIGRLWNDDVEEYFDYKPTHWMPLPEPPEEG